MRPFFFKSSSFGRALRKLPSHLKFDTFVAPFAPAMSTAGFDCDGVRVCPCTDGVRMCVEGFRVCPFSVGVAGGALPDNSSGTGAAVDDDLRLRFSSFSLSFSRSFSAFSAFSFSNFSAFSRSFRSFFSAFSAFSFSFSFAFSVSLNALSEFDRVRSAPGTRSTEDLLFVSAAGASADAVGAASSGNVPPHASAKRSSHACSSASDDVCSIKLSLSLPTCKTLFRFLCSVFFAEMPPSARCSECTGLRPLRTSFSSLYRFRCPDVDSTACRPTHPRFLSFFPPSTSTLRSRGPSFAAMCAADDESVAPLGTSSSTSSKSPPSACDGVRRWWWWRPCELDCEFVDEATSSADVAECTDISDGWSSERADCDARLPRLRDAATSAAETVSTHDSGTNALVLFFINTSTQPSPGRCTTRKMSPASNTTETPSV
eukprot:Opistho-1_new@55393